MDIEYVKRWIKKYNKYEKCTNLNKLNNFIIGYGRNIDEGITIEEAEYLLEGDIQKIFSILVIHPWFYIQPSNIKAALMNIACYLRPTRFFQLTNMFTALEDKNYTDAARQLLLCRWGDTHPELFKDCALMIREGSQNASTGADFPDRCCNMVQSKIL